MPARVQRVEVVNAVHAEHHRLFTVFRKVICATQKQVPRPRSTKIYHSFYFEWRLARRNS